MEKAHAHLFLLTSAALLTLALAARGEELVAPAKRAAWLTPASDIELSTPVASTIRRLLVAEGDKVAEGQILAELDSQTQQLALALSEARLELAAARLAAGKTLLALREDARKLAESRHKAGALTDTEVKLAAIEAESAKGQVVVAEHELELQKVQVQCSRLALSQMTLRAPFSGIVGRVLRYAGEYVAEGQPVLRLLDVDRLHVVTHVALPTALRVRPGMAADFTVEGQPEPHYTCRVLTVAPMADLRGGTPVWTVTLELPNPERKLLPGSPGSVDIRLPADAQK